jgi:hypothetical protein
MLVKCKCHGIKIERDTAFKVTVNNKNEYYCSESDYKKIKEDKENRLLVLKSIDNIFGYTITNTILQKELSELSHIYSYKKIFIYIQDKLPDLNRYMSKDFSSEYGKIKYFTTILRNNLKDYKVKEPEHIKQISTEIVEVKYKPQQRKKCLNDYLTEME